jgi:hypothetical protein
MGEASMRRYLLISILLTSSAAFAETVPVTNWSALPAGTTVQGPTMSAAAVAAQMAQTQYDNTGPCLETE